MFIEARYIEKTIKSMLDGLAISGKSKHFFLKQNNEINLSINYSHQSTTYESIWKSCFYEY